MPFVAKWKSSGFFVPQGDLNFGGGCIWCGLFLGLAGGGLGESLRGGRTPQQRRRQKDNFRQDATHYTRDLSCPPSSPAISSLGFHDDLALLMLCNNSSLNCSSKAASFCPQLLLRWGLKTGSWLKHSYHSPFPIPFTGVHEAYS